MFPLSVRCPFTVLQCLSAPPLPCVSTAFVAKTLPLPCGPQVAFANSYAFHITKGGNRFMGCYIDGGRAAKRPAMPYGSHTNFGPIFMLFSRLTCFGLVFQVFEEAALSRNIWQQGFECCQRGEPAPGTNGSGKRYFPSTHHAAVAATGCWCWCWWCSGCGGGCCGAAAAVGGCWCGSRRRRHRRRRCEWLLMDQIPTCALPPLPLSEGAPIAVSATLCQGSTFGATTLVQVSRS